MANLDEIKAWMRDNRITHEALAAMVGAHRNTVTRALTGKFGSSRVLDQISAIVDRDAELHVSLPPHTRELLRAIADAQGITEQELASRVLQHAMAPLDADSDGAMEAAEDSPDA